MPDQIRFGIRDDMNHVNASRGPPQPAIVARPTCYSDDGAKGANLNDDILNAIDEEIARLRQARAVLAGSSTPSVRRKTTAAAAATVTHKKPRRKLSAKARKAIADAQRKRWAKVKSQKKAAAAPAGKKQPTAK
jgi:hypothetical protein